MGVEPTQDESIAPQTVLKTAPVTGPGAAPRHAWTAMIHRLAMEKAGRSDVA